MEGSDKRPHPWGLRGNRELSKRKKWSMRVQLGRELPKHAAPREEDTTTQASTSLTPRGKKTGRKTRKPLTLVACR